jgi:hypothetical protein
MQSLRHFIEESPVSVMFRGTLEAAFSAERLDQIFEDVAERQVCGELAFSTCADLLSLARIFHPPLDSLGAGDS